MAIQDIFKVSRKTFFNPAAWLDLSALADYNKMIQGSISSLYAPPEEEKPEAFNEALKRFNIKSSELKAIETNYFLFAAFFMVAGVALFLFSFYLLFFHHTFQGWLLGMAVSAFSLAQAFRYHFWYFQIKHHKLGCTFKEWKSGKVNTKEARHD